MSWKRYPRLTALVATLVGGSLLFLGGALAPRSGSADEPVTAAERSDPLAQLIRPAGARLSVADLEAVAEASPDDPAKAARLGFAYIQQARDEADPTAYARARRELNRALDIEPGDFEATLGLAVLAGSTHDFAEQVRIAKVAIATNPHNAYARGVLGDGLIELGQLDKAGHAYQRMIDLRPDLAGYARVSHLFQLRGDSDRALEAMELAAASTIDPRTEAWARSQIGEIHISSGELQQAIGSFDRAHSLAPDYFLPDVGRAHVAYAAGDIERAIELQTSVVDRYPAPAMVGELGDLLWVAGRHAEAEEAYGRSTRLLEELLAEGVMVDVEMPVYFADARRDPARALEMAETIYAGRVGQPAADALAWSLWATGDLRRAEKHIREAIVEGPESPDVFFHAGMIAEARGHDALAIRRLKKALAISPFWSFRDPVIAKATIERLTNGV